MARRTRRLWTDDEKRSICLQTTAPGVSVAHVALRYSVNAKVIGDAKLEEEGKADKIEGKVQNAVGGLKDVMRGE